MSSESSDHHNGSSDTVILTFGSNQANYPITNSDFSGSVGPCQALLAPGMSATDALQCLFTQGFEIVAFTSNGNAITYTLRG
jgi:hypothetical protein